MRRTKSARKPTRRSLASKVVGNLGFVMLAAACIAVFVTIAIVANSASAGGPSTPIAAGWTALPDQSPQTIIAAVKQSPLMVTQHATQGDFLTDLSHLGPPAYVIGIAANPTKIMPSYYIVPVLDGTGTSVGAIVAETNAARNALRDVSIDTYTAPRHTGIVPQIPAAQVAAAVAQGHPQLMAAGHAPDLVYFDIDAQALDVGAITWSGGGELPDDPIWRFAGTDGRSYVLTTDRNVAPVTALPFAP